MAKSNDRISNARRALWFGHRGQWWRFWHQSSGVVGAIIFGGVVFGAVALVVWLGVAL